MFVDAFEGLLDVLDWLPLPSLSHVVSEILRKHFSGRGLYLYSSKGVSLEGTSASEVWVSVMGNSKNRIFRPFRNGKMGGVCGGAVE